MKRDRRNPERGSTALESLWLMAWIFFPLIFGIFELCRFMNVQGMITNAAREGARLAVAPMQGTSSLPGSSEVEAEVRRFLAGAAIPDAGVTVQVIPQNRNGVQCTEVVVQVPYSVMSLAMFVPALEVTLTGDALMRNETSP